MLPTFIKKQWKLILSGCVLTFLVAILASVILSYFEQTYPSEIRVTSSGVISLRPPFLEIQISPPGFPQVGQSWRINVFRADVNEEDKLVYTGANNSTVIVTLSTKGIQKIYELKVDENGETFFTYLSDYDSVAFQAFQEELSSSRKIISGEYLVSDEVVNTFLTFNVASAVGSFASDFFLRPDESLKRKVLRVLPRVLTYCVFCIFAFVTVATLISKIFQGTLWGYPEKILGDLVTFTLLRYVFIIGVVLFIFTWLLKLVIAGLHKRLVKKQQV